MKKFLKGAILVIGLLFFVACGGSDKPKALPSEYIGTYIKKDKNYNTVIKVDEIKDTLLIHYKMIDNENENIVKETTLEIQNALFTTKKENGEIILTLNDTMIKNLKGKKWEKSLLAKEGITVSINSYEEFIQKYGSIDFKMYFTKNETRNDIILNFWTDETGNEFILFVNGIKQ